MEELKHTSTYGKHITLDVWGVEPHVLNDIEFVVTLGERAIDKTGATILDVTKKQFEPQGCTVLFLLSESHMSFHCSPEFGYAAVDCFTCSESCDPGEAIDYVIRVLNPSKFKKQVLIRGVE